MEARDEGLGLLNLYVLREHELHLLRLLLQLQKQLLLLPELLLLLQPQGLLLGQDGWLH